MSGLQLQMPQCNGKGKREAVFVGAGVSNKGKGGKL